MSFMIIQRKGQIPVKQPIVDYRDFRLNRLRDPRFSHLLLLLGWVAYFSLYFLTENLIPAENCTPVHHPLDDVIPFLEVFIIPYIFWYFFVFGSLCWFLFYDVDGFKKLQTYIMITQVIAMIVYIAFPNRQDLRPVVFPRDNLLIDAVAALYDFDTNTGVCPSLHVGYSLGLVSVWLREKRVGVVWKGFVVVSVVTIILSVFFVKQHSFWDFLAAIPMCAVAELLVYRVFYPPGGRAKTKAAKDTVSMR